MSNSKTKKSPTIERLSNDIKLAISNNKLSAESMMPSIRALAVKYDVSPRTVEITLRKLCDENILQNIPRKGYKVLASSIVKNKIAVIHQLYNVGDPRPTITQAVCARLHDLKYTWDSFDVADPHIKIGNLFEEYRGIIFAQQLHLPDVFAKIVANNIPYTIAGRETPIDAPSSFVDRAKLIKSTIKMLFDMGHREIVLIVRCRDLYFYPQLIKAYFEVMRELGLDASENSLAVMENAKELGAYLCAREVLSRPKIPTVIIASRDYQVTGIYQACVEKKLILGKDISVVGYDDIGFTTIPEILTTYEEPCRELGVTAVDILHSILTNKKEPLMREILPQLKLRKSLSPIIEG